MGAGYEAFEQHGAFGTRKSRVLLYRSHVGHRCATTNHGKRHLKPAARDALHRNIGLPK